MGIPKRGCAVKFLMTLSLLVLPMGSVCANAQGRVVRDARTLELEKKFDETRKELGNLTGRLQEMTQPGKPMAERKEYAQRVLVLRRRLLSLKRQMEKRPSLVFRLVKVLGPASSGGDMEGPSIQFRNPEPGYSSKSVRTFGDGNGTWTTTRNLSIGFKLLPKEFTAGHPFGFQIEAKLRDTYPRGYICSRRQQKYPLLLWLTAIVDSHSLSVLSNKSADSDCGPAAICKRFGEREICRLGFIDRDSDVMLRLRYVPVSSEVKENGATRFHYQVDNFTDGKRKEPEKKSVEKALDVHWDLYGNEPKPDEFRIGVKFGESGGIREMPELVLVYRTVRGEAPYIETLPAYHHPAIFRQRPRRNSGILATVPKLLGHTRSQAQTSATKSGLQIRFETGGPAPSESMTATVESQSLPPGSEVPWGKTVVARLYQKYIGLVRVPNLSGLSRAEAQARLQQAGLNHSFVWGRAAPSERLSGTVESQSPSAGSQMKKEGGRVVVRFFGAYQDSRCYGIAEKLRTLRNDSDRLYYLRQAQKLACRIPNLGRELARVERAESQRQMCEGFFKSAEFTQDSNQKLIFYKQALAMGCRDPRLGQRIAGLERRVQHERMCGNLIQTANASRSVESRLRILRQARSNQCQAPGLANAIASLEREVQRQQQCNAFLRNAKVARSDAQKLYLYRQAKRIGCQARGLDQAIAFLDRAVKQQRMCDDLIGRGNRANSDYARLNYYRNAKNRGCRVRGLDQAIASLDRRVQQQRRCDQLLRNAGQERNQQKKLGLLRQAKQGGCRNSGLDRSIANLERTIQKSRQRPPSPTRTPGSNVGRVGGSGSFGSTRTCDCYDRKNGYYATFLGFCNTSMPVKPCVKIKGQTPGY